MKKYEKEKYYYLLERYLTYNGAVIKNNMFSCLNKSAHENGDQGPSVSIFRNRKTGRLNANCFGCDFGGDIFDVAGWFNNTKDFKQQYEIIEKLYGSPETLPDPPENKKHKSKKDDTVKLVSLDLDRANQVYSKEEINSVREYAKSDIIKTGEIKDRWPYTDKDNNVCAVDVRFEGVVKNKNGVEKNEKQTVTFWYNGKSLKFTGSFNIIYNLFESLDTEKPLLIHEGAKCARLGKTSLEQFCNVSYNRGAKSAGLPDWSIYKDRKIYILQDNDTPGNQAAMRIKEKLPQAIILKDIYKNFNIHQKKGADIEQLLEVSGPEQIEDYILHYEEARPDQTDKEVNKQGPVCLGIDDNNYLFFIDRFGRVIECRREGVTRNFLKPLCSLSYWKENYFDYTKFQVDWEQATEDILTSCEGKEFDSTKIRGRGAWKDGEGIVYHDGKKTFGADITGEYMYIKKNQVSIGIEDNPIDKKILFNLWELCSHMTFENKTDIVRLLGWSIISPFCGALIWRTPILLTGDSGSGKSEILEKIALPLSGGLYCDAHSTSEAGIRAAIKNDSRAICLEETENSESPDKSREIHRNNLFSMMRASSSEGAPDGFKSNKDQKSIRYSMKNMFLFVSISPIISQVADANRIFTVNFIKPEKRVITQKWEDVERELLSILTEKNCRKTRALTWSLLPKIIEDTERIIRLIRYEIGGQSARRAKGEAVLISAFLNVILDIEMTDEKIIEFLQKYYKTVKVEIDRDQSVEILERIFAHKVAIGYDTENGFGSKRTVTKTFSIKEILNDCYKENCSLEGIIFDDIKQEYYRALGQNGLKLTGEKVLAIVSNHPEIMKITGQGHGFGKLLKRHPFVIENKSVSILGDTKYCIMIDIYRRAGEEGEEGEEEIPF